MNAFDRAALLSVLELNGEAEVRRRYEAGQFNKKRWQAELPVIEEWLAAWRACGLVELRPDDSRDSCPLLITSAPAIGLSVSSHRDALLLSP